MKREVIFIFAFVFLLVFISLIYASEEEQVQSAYSCVESKINQTGCSSLPFEDRVFSALATGKCMGELSRDNSTTLTSLCWPKSGCTIKSTAQAIFVLNRKVNTTKAEDWLLSRTGIPEGIDWFLEIEGTGVTQCKITYLGTPHDIVIGVDRKIKSNAGSSLTLAQDNYWLKIAPSIYNQEITISCNTSFITTLLFKKQGSSTVHVSNIAPGSSSNGDTNEVVRSLCFKDGNGCNYEGSLWATLALYSLDKDYPTSDFMPYLITMMDDPNYKKYLPESFLYILTGGKFRTELLLKQKAQSYWEAGASGSRYFDTALALFPFPPDSYDVPEERGNSVTWLLKNQERSGCWNNNNLKDTAFLLYSIWPKGISDCPIIECKIPSQNLDGECSYADVQCGIDNDGCCSSGCAYADDNDCADTRCTANPDICSEEDHISDPYCSDGDVYEEVYTGECADTGTCVQNVDENLVQSCSGSETCEGGECISGGTECGLFNPCDDGYNCIAGVCEPIGGACQDSSECDDGYECNNGVCEYIDTSCGFFNPCDDGYNCIGGECIPNTCAQDGCPDGQVCIADECIDEGCTADNIESFCTGESCKATSCQEGTCLYEFLNCTNDDYCCNPGCNITTDNDCPPGPECTSNATCAIDNYVDGPYCSSDLRKVYSDFYNYSCESESCIYDLTTKLIKTCASTEECWDGECVGPETPQGCEDDFGCGYDEQCIAGECEPYECTSNGECSSGNCTGGYCVSGDLLDCTDEGYFCTSSVNCENSFGTSLDNYFCSGALYVCCNEEPILRRCDEEGGDICTSDEECLDGVLATVSDTMSDETCCTIGTCEIKTVTTYCTDENGMCRESCGSDEEEKSYTCDAVGDTCCVSGETPPPSRLWILIVIFLLLIALAVGGIVFRDKLRVQWIKLKDKLGGKKDKKKIEMPLTSYPNPQGRILPRRIFPPGQGPQQPLQRPQQPVNQIRRPMQPSTQNKPVQTVKKPEEKPKNELDDVLKKLKEMGK